MKRYQYILLLCAWALAACAPQVDPKSDLGPAPSPSFEILPGDSPNDFILKNTTEGAFLTSWDLGGIGTAKGEEVEANFPFRGEYEVTMTTFNRGGHASTSNTVTVTQDDPDVCFGNFALLTDCSEKVWKIAPEAGAIHIGPNLTDTWWGNSFDDITVRDCHFDDEYIFRVSGEFEYDNKGNFWADSDGDGNIFPSDLGLEVGCNASTDWPEKYQAWDSGIHSFTINETSLTVTGTGAWIGLYKIGTTAEVDSPQESVTFSISEISETRMVLFADYGWGIWRVTLVSN